MNKLRFKRFDSMQGSKEKIMNRTKKQIQSNSIKKEKRKSNGFFISAVVILSCIFLWGLKEMVTIYGVNENASNIETLNFSGDLFGRLHYSKDEFYFQPDETSIRAFPELKGFITSSSKIVFNAETERLLHKYISFDSQDVSQAATLNVRGLQAVDELKDTYLAKNVEVLELPSEHYDELFSFNLSLDPEGNIVLDSQLEDIFNEFSIAYNQDLLEGLQPHEVFQLYLFAEEQKNDRALYELINDDEDYFKPTLEEYMKESEIDVNRNKIIDNPFKNKELYVMDEGSNEAYIITKYKEHFFGMSKNSNGIWLVNLLPIQ
ncbi:hypothetical protein [Lysinibacillus sp. 54212]|uniref:hypothetical protein n=1 Tax=Lysinibacillus sp. 54212 TaxID=3119829 RepID=UPI002FCC2CE1